MPVILFQLEDDIVATNDYYDMMLKYALQQGTHPWLILEFSQLGFIGVCVCVRVCVCACVCVCVSLTCFNVFVKC